jgi:glycosyltransferase involved in cell wall biosynthesis
MPSYRRKIFIVDPDNFTPLYDLNLAKALGEEGWEVEWVTSAHQFESMPDTRTVTVREAFFRNLKGMPLRHFHRIPFLPNVRRIFKALSYPLDLISLDLAFRAQKPGIIHVQWALLPYLDSAFWEKWRRRGWVVVFTCHDPIPLSGSLPMIFLPSNYRLCTASDSVIVHGRWARRFLEASGVPGEQIHIVEPGPPSSGTSVTRAQARLALGLSPAAPILLFFGYIKPYKGLRTLLESLSMIRAAVGDFQLLIAGEIMEPFRRYEHFIKKHGLTKIVRWSGGYVPDSLSSVYFAAADVVVLPYHEASSSGVLLNAYRAGRPVVASAVGDIPTMVEDGRSGLLVPPRNPAALARAVVSILRDPTRGRSMGTTGQQLVDSRFNWAMIAKRTGELYSRLSLQKTDT